MYNARERSGTALATANGKLFIFPPEIRFYFILLLYFFPSSPFTRVLRVYTHAHTRKAKTERKTTGRVRGNDRENKSGRAGEERDGC